MGDIRNHLRIDIEIVPPRRSKKSFGVPLIVMTDAPLGGSTLVTAFDDPEDLRDLGLDEGDQAFNDATILMSQDPCPEYFLLGKKPAATAMAAAIANIRAVNDDWFGLLLASRTTADILAAARAIQALPDERLFVAQTHEAAVLAAAYNPLDVETDVMSQLLGERLSHTVPIYAEDTKSTAAGIMGRMLPVIPGSETWKWKSIAGVSHTNLLAQERLNLISKNGNVYEFVAGEPMFSNGTTATGLFADDIHGEADLHWQMQADVFYLLKNIGKLVIDQPGLDSIGMTMEGALERKANDNFLSKFRVDASGKVVTPGYTVKVPRLESIPPSERTLRRMIGTNRFTFDAARANAVHELEIHGQLT
jgi:hypothetical protein